MVDRSRWRFIDEDGDVSDVTLTPKLLPQVWIALRLQRRLVFDDECNTVLGGK